MRAVVFAGAGGNEVVRVEERAHPTPGTDEVLVRVRFAGLNPADTAQRAGRYPAPPGSPQDIPGLELAGTVEAVGEKVLAWQPGDRVFGLVGGGGLADRVLVHERHVARVPDALDERDAAAIPEAFITAHDAVRSAAGLRLGETLLVQGASGGVGTAAVQIGRAAGARVLGVVRSGEAAELVRELGGEPIPHEGFCAAVLEATDDRGADVILELVGSPHFPDNLDALAMLGRVMIVGVGAGNAAQIPFRPLMAKRASIRGSSLRPRTLEEKATAVRAFEKEVVPHLATGAMRAVIDSVYPVERITEAFDRLDGTGKRGKLLVEFP